MNKCFLQMHDTFFLPLLLGTNHRWLWIYKILAWLQWNLWVLIPIHMPFVPQREKIIEKAWGGIGLWGGGEHSMLSDLTSVMQLWEMIIFILSPISLKFHNWVVAQLNWVLESCVLQKIKGGWFCVSVIKVVLQTHFLKTVFCTSVIHPNCPAYMHWYGRPSMLYVVLSAVNYKLMIFAKPTEMVCDLCSWQYAAAVSSGQSVRWPSVLDSPLSSIVFLSMCSSIHDHTDSHCFLKMLQGNLKETLFAWPDKKSNEMIKKSERILRENQCAYINGNNRLPFSKSKGWKSLQLPSETLQNWVHGVMVPDT